MFFLIHFLAIKCVTKNNFELHEFELKLPVFLLRKKINKQTLKSRFEFAYSFAECDHS